MSVYIDNERNGFGRMHMCHMMADTLEELHAMADVIGVKRKWFQNKRTPHYDICLAKRALALKSGAIEIDRKQMVLLMSRIRNDETTTK